MSGDLDAIRNDTALVIPAYNAAPQLPAVVENASRFIPRSRILVVDDGSTDGTGEVARKTGAIVLEHGENRGKGIALNTGILAAGRLGARFVITMDADGQHDPEEIPVFIEKELETGADIIVGNRMAEKKNMPGDRIFANLVTSWFVSARAGVRIPDSQNGYRFIRVALYERIAVRASRYEAESEILIRAGKAGGKIVSLPVRTIYASEKSSVNRVVDTIRFLRMAMKSFFW